MEKVPVPFFKICLCSAKPKYTARKNGIPLMKIKIAPYTFI